jgi:hypothetical protein
MRERFSIGSVARLDWDLIAAGVGQTGQSPVIAIQRRVDCKWFNAPAGLFQAAPVANPMAELDPTNLPGRYSFDFDHARDLLVSSDFVVKLANAGPPPALAYRDISFGPLPSVSAPLLCSIQGSLFDDSGEPDAGQLVQATLIPVLTDALGRGFRADAIRKTYTATDGSFDLPMPRGATIRLEIRAIGYDRRALVPDQTSVLFTKL